jgi:hypothetical protein
LILFLDIDGVLHPDPPGRNELFNRLPLFEAALKSLRHVEIVVSSAWRETRTLGELRLLFSDDIAIKIIGVTPFFNAISPPADLVPYPRHAEIDAWLKSSGRSSSQWVAIDDRNYWFKPFLSNLIVCDATTGLTETVAETLKEKLCVNR